MMFRILKMPVSSHDYFRYLPLSPSSAPWGLSVTAAGYTEVKPGMNYPPMRHPNDHDFDWTTGRKLDALQIVSIQLGKGWFESKPTGRKRIAAGSAFAVLPGTWHRYRPDPATGWTESWVEMKGGTVNRLIEAGVFQKKRPLRIHAATTRLDEALNALHSRIRNASAGFDPGVAASAFEVLAAWANIGRAPRDARPNLAKVAVAERYLTAHHNEPIDMKAFARSSGIAYSHFRKLFREHTGYAPWAYVLRIRLVRGRRLLLQTGGTLEEIASELGFSSAFHFSAAFKNAFGESPRSWRAKHWLV